MGHLSLGTCTRRVVRFPSGRCLRLYLHPLQHGSNHSKRVDIETEGYRGTMPNTNRVTVRHKNKTLDLSTMPREELEYLRTQILLDLHDIEQQVSWAKYQQKADGIEYDHGWMRGALKAARIKEDDISKIDDLLEGMPYTRDKAMRDIIELKRAVRQFLVNRMLGTELEDLIRRLDQEYGYE